MNGQTTNERQAATNSLRAIVPAFVKSTQHMEDKDTYLYLLSYITKTSAWGGCCVFTLNGECGNNRSTVRVTEIVGHEKSRQRTNFMFKQEGEGSL